MQRQLVVGFFYSWSPDRKLDGYFTKVAESIAKLGYDLKIILGSDFLSERGHQALNPDVDEEKLLSYVNRLKPAYVFSINNAGMFQGIQAKFDCPVIKWFVDDLPHVFLHDGVDSLKQIFFGHETIFAYSSALESELKQRFPFCAERVHFSHHATDLKAMRSHRGQPLYGISFVASCLDSQPFIDYLRRLRTDRQFSAMSNILKLSSELERDYALDFESRVVGLELTEALKFLNISWLDLKRVLSDVLTTQHRTAAILCLADLDFHLFGNDRWIDSVAVSNEIVRVFHFEQKISSFADLANVYQSSKISINVPNIQNSNGLAARVFDIMGSNSLLVCDEAGSQDLKRIFGSDFAVPVYRDLDELRAICLKYLADETLRREFVEKCQAQITEHHSFENVMNRMITRSGAGAGARNGACSPGTIEYVNRFKFIKPTGLLTKASRFVFRRGIARLRAVLKPSLRTG